MRQHVRKQPLGRHLLVDGDPKRGGVPASSPHQVVGVGRPHCVVPAKVVQEGGHVVPLPQQACQGRRPHPGDLAVDHPELVVEQERVQSEKGPVNKKMLVQGWLSQTLVRAF